MKTMEEEMKEMLDQIQNASTEITTIFEIEEVEVKQTGWMCENIFMVDFRTKAEFESAVKLMETEKPEACYRMVDYPKTKRIVFHF